MARNYPKSVKVVFEYDDHCNDQRMLFPEEIISASWEMPLGQLLEQSVDRHDEECAAQKEPRNDGGMDKCDSEEADKMINEATEKHSEFVAATKCGDPPTKEQALAMLQDESLGLRPLPDGMKAYLLGRVGGPGDLADYVVTPPGKESALDVAACSIRNGRDLVGHYQRRLADCKAGEFSNVMFDLIGQARRLPGSIHRIAALLFIDDGNMDPWDYNGDMQKRYQMMAAERYPELAPKVKTATEASLLIKSEQARLRKPFGEAWIDHAKRLAQVKAMVTPQSGPMAPPKAVTEAPDLLSGIPCTRCDNPMVCVDKDGHPFCEDHRPEQEKTLSEAIAHDIRVLPHIEHHGWKPSKSICPLCHTGLYSSMAAAVYFCTRCVGMVKAPAKWEYKTGEIPMEAPDDPVIRFEKKEVESVPALIAETKPCYCFGPPVDDCPIPAHAKRAMESRMARSGGA